MDNKEILKRLKEEFNNIDEDTLKRVIYKYNHIFLLFHDIGLSREDFYKNKWNHISKDDFKSLLLNLIRLDQKNALDTIEPVALISLTGSHIVTITNYLSKLIEYANASENKELAYYSLFSKVLDAIYIKDKDQYINKCRLVSDEEKKIIHELLPIYRIYLYNDDELPFDTCMLVSLSYSYFKYHNMFETNYDDIMKYLERLKNDVEYVTSKFELNNIKSIKDVFIFFEGYYNDSKSKRHVLK